VSRLRRYIETRRREQTFSAALGPLGDEKFSPLATYNSEVGRGLVHTPEWAARMAKLQQEFDDLRDRATRS